MYLAVVACLLLGCGRSGFQPVADAAAIDTDDAAVTRVTDGLRALYTFEEGTGVITRDVSGIAPALDIQLGTATDWIPRGIEFQPSAGAAVSAAAATKITDACLASGEVTTEAWVAATTTVGIGAARIVAVGAANNISVLSLGLEAGAYYGQIRTTTASTKLASTQAASTDLVHLVHTRTIAGVRALYLDGAQRGASVTGGTFDNWEATLPVTLGNAIDGGVSWSGRMFLVAIYCRALTTDEVLQNLAAGP